MKLGIIGLPQAGKTTIFNALTRGDQPVTMNGRRFEIHQAVVDVPDARVERLVGLFHPQKVTHAKVVYTDIAGVNGDSKKQELSGALLNELSQMDGFIQVVRCFDNPTVPHPVGKVDPERDLISLESELLLNDLIHVERKLERLEVESRKGGGRDKMVIRDEFALFTRLKDTLSEERPLRVLEFSVEEQNILSGFGFLTLKPMLLVLNLSEDQSPPQIEYSWPQSEIIPIRGQLEMELTRLPEDEAEIFMHEYGIEELSLSRLIRASYELLGLQSFFTVGEDEVRAWTVHQNATAVEAAGAIHSDLAKGFIRAEVIPWDELISLGGLVEARKQGKLRLEGRDYRVQEGNILHVRFNI